MLYGVPHRRDLLLEPQSSQKKDRNQMSQAQFTFVLYIFNSNLVCIQLYIILANKINRAKIGLYQVVWIVIQAIRIIFNLFSHKRSKNITLLFPQMCSTSLLRYLCWKKIAWIHVYKTTFVTIQNSYVWVFWSKECKTGE